MPIKGTRGIGYVLRKGLDLPRLMFTADEVDAIAVGARMVRRLRDPGQQKAANRVLAKVTTALPGALRSGLLEAPLEKPRLPISRSAVRSELRTEHGCAAHHARSSPPTASLQLNREGGGHFYVAQGRRFNFARTIWSRIRFIMLSSIVSVDICCFFSVSGGGTSRRSVINATTRRQRKLAYP
jgi:hypothetical protein